MSDSNPDTTTYRQTGEQLDNELATLRARLDDFERQLSELDYGPDPGPSEDLTELEESVTRLRTAIEDHSTTIAAAQNRLDDLERRAEALEGRLDEGVGTDLDTELERLRRERQRFSLVGSPSHTRTIVQGPHEDEGYHPHGAWGIVVTPREDVVWREATVNAGSAGSTLLEVYDMAYEKDETYDVGNLLETHEVTVDRSGENTIHPDILLEEGRTVFITRDSDLPASQALPLKRGAENVNWGTINDNDVPVTIHCTWQLGRSGPGTQAFEDYRTANWHRTLHNYRNLEFGFDELEG